jgi:anti-sigma B factor antagonist
VVTVTDGSSFSLDLVVPADADAVVTVAGELDMFRAPAFEAVLDRSIDQGARSVVVDLDGVNFIDSSGISVIVGAAARLHEAEGSLSVVYGDPQVRRIFEILTLDKVVGVYECRREARAAPGRDEEPA